MYDYIIVGAGSAGCVLANRLSADPDCQVLLIEAGPRDRHPFIHMPAGLSRLVNLRAVNWNYDTEPQPALGGRRLWWPRGKVLGGSSSINAMCYARGDRLDYDDWARAGASGWDWQGVLPYFRRSERNQQGADALHGGDGPLHVSDLRHRNPLSEAFVTAGVQAGMTANPDFNGHHQAGVGYYQVTQKDGARCSAAVAYLHPARARGNLHVLTGVQVHRVRVEDGRAVGVEFARRGVVDSVRAAREVLLCAGAVNSPQLLMLSGIGPAAHLQAHGLPVHSDLPGVGANLQDHLDICTLVHTVPGVSYDRASELAIALRYFLGGRRCARRHPAAFRPRHARRPWPPPPPGRWLHLARLLPAAAQPRQRAPAQCRPARPTRDRSGVPERCRRLRPADDAGVRPALAPHPRPTRVRPVARQTDLPRARRSR